MISIPFWTKEKVVGGKLWPEKVELRNADRRIKMPPGNGLGAFLLTSISR